MEIIPQARMTKFSDVQPGDLFLYMDGQNKFYAIRTQGPQTTMVMLGPSFHPPDVTEAFLFAWDVSTVLSFGKDYSILLPTDAASWVWSGQTRSPPIWLAVAGDSMFICANGGRSSQNYFPCFVDVKTGAILGRSLPGTSVYTNTWEIAVLGNNYPPRTILKFPLPEPE
jgi:hypothetical protein